MLKTKGKYTPGDFDKQNDSDDSDSTISSCLRIPFRKKNLSKDSEVAVQISSYTQSSDGYGAQDSVIKGLGITHRSHDYRAQNGVTDHSQRNLLKNEIIELTPSPDSLQRELDKCRQELASCQLEKNGLLSRLSEMMGRKLEENNPKITNLNDPNRTQKLAEMLGNIYDDDWTDTFSELQSELPNITERQCADILINVLKIVYTECIGHVRGFCSHIQLWFKGAKKCSHTHILEFVASIADTLIPHLQEQIIKALSSRYEEPVIKVCRNYISRCVNLCFYMTIKSPEMYLEFTCLSDRVDKNIFRPFTKSGDTLAYVVWPALYLHVAGPLITRGIVQCQ